MSAQKKFLFDGKLPIKTEATIEVHDDDTESNDAEYQEGEVFHEELKIFGSDNETSNLDMHNENTIDEFVDDSGQDFHGLDQSDSGG